MFIRPTVAIAALQNGGVRRGRPSVWTAEQLRAWRVVHGLYVWEMADLLGWPPSTLQKKLGGQLSLTLFVDRALTNIELLVAAGIVPDGAPLWLQLSIITGQGWQGGRRRRRSLITHSRKISRVRP